MPTWEHKKRMSLAQKKMKNSMWMYASTGITCRSQQIGKADEEEPDEMRLRGAKHYDYFIILPDDPFKVSVGSIL